MFYACHLWSSNDHHKFVYSGWCDKTLELKMFDYVKDFYVDYGVDVPWLLLIKNDYS